MSDLIKRFKSPVLFFVSGSLLQRHLLTFCINSIFHFLKKRRRYFMWQFIFFLLIFICEGSPNSVFVVSS